MMSNKKKQQIRGLQRSISDSRMHRMIHNDENNDDNKNENKNDDGRHHHSIEEDNGMVRRRNPKSNPKHTNPRSPQVGIIDNTKIATESSSTSDTTMSSLPVSVADINNNTNSSNEFYNNSNPYVNYDENLDENFDENFDSLNDEDVDDIDIDMTMIGDSHSHSHSHSHGNNHNASSFVLGNNNASNFIQGQNINNINNIITTPGTATATTTATMQEYSSTSDMVFTMICLVSLLLFCVLCNRRNIPSAQYHRGAMIRRQAEDIWANQAKKKAQQEIPIVERALQIQQHLHVRTVVSKCSKTGCCILSSSASSESSSPKETEQPTTIEPSSSIVSRSSSVSVSSAVLALAAMEATIHNENTDEIVAAPCDNSSPLRPNETSPFLRSETSVILSQQQPTTTTPVTIINSSSSYHDQSQNNNDDHEDDDDVCPICIDNFDIGDTVMWPKSSTSSAQCAHVFHEECILQWLLVQRENECPSCRFCFFPSDNSTKSMTTDDTDDNTNSTTDTASTTAAASSSSSSISTSTSALASASASSLEVTTTPTNDDSDNHEKSNSNSTSSGGADYDYDIEQGGCSSSSNHNNSNNDTNDTIMEEEEDDQEKYIYVITKGLVQRVLTSSMLLCRSTSMSTSMSTSI